MTSVDRTHAVLWTWDEPIPFTRPSHGPSAAPFDGYRLPLAVALGSALVALLTLAVLVVFGVL